MKKYTHFLIINLILCGIIHGDPIPNDPLNEAVKVATEARRKANFQADQVFRKDLALDKNHVKVNEGVVSDKVHDNHINRHDPYGVYLRIIGDIKVMKMRIVDVERDALIQEQEIIKKQMDTPKSSNTPSKALRKSIGSVCISSSYLDYDLALMKMILKSNKVHFLPEELAVIEIIGTQGVVIKMKLEPYLEKYGISPEVNTTRGDDDKLMLKELFP